MARDTAGDPSRTPLAAGHDALGRGDWAEARAYFERVLTGGERADALEGLATAAYYLEDVEAVFAARERAFALYREQGDAVAAARLALDLAIDVMDYRPDSAVANGWMQRAGRLLEGLPETREHGMLGLLRGHQALMGEGDLARARELAAGALAIARQTGAQDVEMMAIALEGLAAVSAGEVRHGMGLLDEATSTALSGEVREPNLAATACCYLIHACDRVRDFGRAHEWCQRVRAYCERWRFTNMFTLCRTQYASVLIAQGEWPEAERELAAALAELEAKRPAMAPSALVRLAWLRTRQGRDHEAQALLARCAGHRSAPLVAGALAMRAGRFDDALTDAARALRRAGEQDRTERVAALELANAAAAAAGDAVRAGGAAEELRAIADAVGTDALRGAARAAEARLVAGTAAARSAWEESLAFYRRAGMAWDSAAAELSLARTLRVLGHEDEAREHANGAAAAFERLGAAADLAAANTVAISGPSAVVREGPLTTRELEVLRLVAEGLADREIAERLFLSPHTVHRHVANILSKLDVPTRGAAVASANRRRLLD